MGKKLIFLLVCEGPSDIPIIKRVTEEICKQTGKTVEVRHISPQQDGTGCWERHGWTGVMRWCGLYGDKKQEDLDKLPETIRHSVKRKNWRALLQLGNADGLIIQMDTDIAHELTNLPDRFDITENSRRKYCEDSILSKIGMINTDPNLVLLLPSFSTETWIVATFDESHYIFKNEQKPIEFEKLSNCEQLLIDIGMKKERKKGKYKLKKSHDIYIQHAETIVNNIETVKKRCAEVNTYQDKIKQF